MAKDSYSNINNIIGQFDKEGSMLDEYEQIEVTEHIHTGNYLFNAHISGSIFGGLPVPKAICIAGDPKTGKSYLLFNISREAQKQGYFLWLIETEGSPDKTRLENQGIELGKARISQPDTISEVQKMVLPFLRDVQKMKPEDRPKVIIAIDSISSLSSQKVFNDSDSGKVKTDMGTEAKELGALMKAMIPLAGKVGIPIIFTAHTYMSSDIFGNTSPVPSGGRKAIYMSSVAVILTKKLDKDYKDKKYLYKGIEVKSTLYEGRYSKPVDVKFYLSFLKGMNPYIGLQNYISWEGCGIGKGSIKELVDPIYELYLINKKSLDVESLIGVDVTYDNFNNLANSKKSSWEASLQWYEMNKYIVLNEHSFTINESIRNRFPKGITKPTEKIPVPNDNSPKYVARHLSYSFPKEQLFNKDVFTHERLQELDQNVISKEFKFSESDFIEDEITYDDENEN